MHDEPLIAAENLSKKFCKSVPLSMRYGLRDVMRRFRGLEIEKDHLRPGEFWVLQDIHFKVCRGEALVLIGPNGSGKSTLLKVLQGIYEPDQGKVLIRGRVTGLMALGTCFHPDYTGRENIPIYAAALGLKNRWIHKEMDSIIEFAGIGDAIDSPAKHYSHGTYMRLGFSVAVHSHAEIFLIDEALTVGDLAFIAKCKQKIEELLKSGCCVICITHNLGLAKMLFQKAIWLDRGRLKAYGEVAEVCEQYEEYQASRQLQFQR